MKTFLDERLLPILVSSAHALRCRAAETKMDGEAYRRSQTKTAFVSSSQLKFQIPPTSYVTPTEQLKTLSVLFMPAAICLPYRHVSSLASIRRFSLADGCRKRDIEFFISVFTHVILFN